MKTRTRKTRAMQAHRLNDGWGRRLWILHHIDTLDWRAMGAQWGNWMLDVRYDTETWQKVLAEKSARRARG